MISPAHQARYYQVAQALAIASAVFLLLAGGLLLFNQFQGKVKGFVQSKELVRLQAELKKRPKDEALKQQIRQFDLTLRRNTFYQLELSHRCSEAMLWAAAVFLASAHFVRVFRKQPPNPLQWGTPKAEELRQSGRYARYAVAVVFGLVAAAGVAVSVHPVQLPERKLNGSADAPEPVVTTEELAANWPVFRGLSGLNFAKETTAGTNVIWKTEVPLPGLSSPIRWGSAIFLTGASKEENRVFRFDANTGQLVWSMPVKVINGPKPGFAKVNEDTGLAAPTAATDGRRVYAIFANGDVAAFNMDGKQVWAKSLGLINNSYGYASSLALHEDKLLIQLDQASAEDGKSQLLALNTRTGQPIWSVKREVGGSWASPIVIEVDGQAQIVTCADPFVIAYSVADGAELWRTKCLTGDVAPSPLFAGGMVIAISPGHETVALKPSSKGEVAWKQEEGVPETSSPASDGQRLFLMNSGGTLTCLDLATGKVKWSKELEGEIYASPVVAGNGVVVVLRAGTVVLAENGAAYRELAKFSLGEQCMTTPVLDGSRMYLRGTKHLFCLEASAAGGSK